MSSRRFEFEERIKRTSERKVFQGNNVSCHLSLNENQSSSKKQNLMSLFKTSILTLFKKKRSHVTLVRNTRWSIKDKRWKKLKKRRKRGLWLQSWNEFKLNQFLVDEINKTGKLKILKTNRNKFHKILILILFRLSKLKQQENSICFQLLDVERSMITNFKTLLEREHTRLLNSQSTYQLVNFEQSRSMKDSN